MFWKLFLLKLAINMSRSLPSIFSNSLGSFLETNNFFNNETSLCVLLNVFLFSAVQTLVRSNRPTQTCYSLFRPRHLLKKNSEEAPLKSRQIWNARVECKLTMNDSDWLTKAFTLKLIGYTSTCENSYTPAILIGYISVSSTK